jgi:hypothetical protein
MTCEGVCETVCEGVYDGECMRGGMTDPGGRAGCRPGGDRSCPPPSSLLIPGAPSPRHRAFPSSRKASPFKITLRPALRHYYSLAP